VLIACTTGMRRGEICALRWEDVDLAEGTATVKASMSYTPKAGLKRKTTKTDRVRVVGLPLLTIAELEDERRSRVCPAGAPVIGAVHPDDLTKLWRVVADSLGLQGVRLHDLRHSFATETLLQGASIKDLQDALGHSRAQTTTDTYLHVTERMRQRRTEMVDRAFSATPEPLGDQSEADIVPIAGTSETGPA